MKKTMNMVKMKKMMKIKKMKGVGGTWILRCVLAGPHPRSRKWVTFAAPRQISLSP